MSSLFQSHQKRNTVPPTKGWTHLGVGQKRYPTWNPGKLKQPPKPEVPWSFNFDPYPTQHLLPVVSSPRAARCPELRKMYPEKDWAANGLSSLRVRSNKPFLQLAWHLWGGTWKVHFLSREPLSVAMLVGGRVPLLFGQAGGTLQSQLQEPNFPCFAGKSTQPLGYGGFVSGPFSSCSHRETLNNSLGFTGLLLKERPHIAGAKPTFSLLPLFSLFFFFRPVNA